ncbi:MAG: nucleotidyltransferase family protein, partial [Pseudomonadota bacterium]
GSRRRPRATQAGLLRSYDESYYRTLSHELPPMRHPEFDFELDVHHSVIAPTHRYSVDMDAVLREIVPVPGSAFFVLGEVDQIVHSATHLLTAEEFERGLRDLHDIQELATSLATREINADDILSRARDVGLYDPVHPAHTASRTHFGPGCQGKSTLPEDGNHRLSRKLVAWSLRHLLFDEKGAPSNAKRLAAAYIWMRAQALRMPWYSLLRHTYMKLGQRLKPEL